uniref:Capsid protein n=1 Tax=Hainan black-spectacled toad astrovirus 2 TaxID=2116132 RepID=A0A2P1GMF0_9VIRU|nr:capsid protein [Hainan black-spectacled toad astrovirus 2]
MSAPNGPQAGASGAMRGRQRSRSRSRGRARSRSRGRVATKVTIVEPPKERRPRSSSRSRAKNTQRKQKPLKKLEREVKALKKKTDGPKVAKTMSGTLTVGLVPGNDNPQDSITQIFHVLLNPVLMKENGAGNNPTPLVECAKQYAMWKCVSLKVRLLSMVGNANLGGTLGVASLDQDAQAVKPLDLDNILTRPYCEIPLGQSRTWSVPPRFLEGPREGWWLVNTNELAGLSVGPSVDFHTFGRTIDLLSVNGGQVATYKGPLWLMQMTYTFHFSNYENKPAYSTLVSESIPVENVVFKTGPDGDLEVSLSEPTFRLHQLLSYGGKKKISASGGQTHLGDTIFQIAGDVVDTLAETAPGPWGWLLKGGLWFARRLFTGPGYGLHAEANPTLRVYPSVENAQRDQPIDDSGITTDIPVPYEAVTVTQLNSQNLEVNTNTAGDGPAPGSVQYPIPFYTTMKDPFKQQGFEHDASNWDETILFCIQGPDTGDMQGNYQNKGMGPGYQMRIDTVANNPYTGKPEVCSPPFWFEYDTGGGTVREKTFITERILSTGKGSNIKANGQFTLLRNYTGGQNVESTLGTIYSIMSLLDAQPPSTLTCCGWYRVRPGAGISVIIGNKESVTAWPQSTWTKPTEPSGGNVWVTSGNRKSLATQPHMINGMCWWLYEGDTGKFYGWEFGEQHISSWFFPHVYELYTRSADAGFTRRKPKKVKLLPTQILDVGLHSSDSEDENGLTPNTQEKIKLRDGSKWKCGCAANEEGLHTCFIPPKPHSEISDEGDETDTSLEVIDGADHQSTPEPQLVQQLKEMGLSDNNAKLLVRQIEDGKLPLHSVVKSMNHS